jgi:hypothetical protein
MCVRAWCVPINEPINEVAMQVKRKPKANKPVCVADPTDRDPEAAEAIERAFRRGYYQAASDCLQWLRSGKGLGMLAAWIEELYDWRYRRNRKGQIEFELPPEPGDIKPRRVRRRR